jgi:hypothetical protein
MAGRDGHTRPGRPGNRCKRSSWVTLANGSSVGICPSGVALLTISGSTWATASLVCSGVMWACSASLVSCCGSTA